MIPVRYMIDDITQQFIECVYNDCELLRREGHAKDLGTYLHATFAYLKFNMEANGIRELLKTEKMIKAILIMI